MSNQTLGQRLVGLDFNPSGSEKVNKVKQHFADIIDLVTEGAESEAKLQEMFTDLAVAETIKAQMVVVKAITWEKKQPAVEASVETPTEMVPPAPAEPSPVEPTPTIAPEPTQIPVATPDPEPPVEPTPQAVVVPAEPPTIQPHIIIQ